MKSSFPPGSSPYLDLRISRKPVLAVSIGLLYIRLNKIGNLWYLIFDNVPDVVRHEVPAVGQPLDNNTLCLQSAQEALDAFGTARRAALKWWTRSNL